MLHWSLYCTPPHLVDVSSRKLVENEWSFTTSWLETDASLEKAGGSEVIRLAYLFTKGFPDIFAHTGSTDMHMMAAETKAEHILNTAKRKPLGLEPTAGSEGCAGKGVEADNGARRMLMPNERPKPPLDAPPIRLQLPLPEGQSGSRFKCWHPAIRHLTPMHGTDHLHANIPTGSKCVRAPWRGEHQGEP